MSSWTQGHRETSYVEHVARPSIGNKNVSSVMNVKYRTPATCQKHGTLSKHQSYFWVYTRCGILSHSSNNFWHTSIISVSLINTYRTLLQILKIKKKKKTSMTSTLIKSSPLNWQYQMIRTKNHTLEHRSSRLTLFFKMVIHLVISPPPIYLMQPVRVSKCSHPYGFIKISTTKDCSNSHLFKDVSYLEQPLRNSPYSFHN